MGVLGFRGFGVLGVQGFYGFRGFGFRALYFFSFPGLWIRVQDAMSEVFSHVEVSKSRSNGVVVGTEIRLWSLYRIQNPILIIKVAMFSR